MVEYQWQYPKPVNILNMELAEFDLTKTEYTIDDVEYVAGTNLNKGLVHLSDKVKLNREKYIIPQGENVFSSSHERGDKEKKF